MGSEAKTLYDNLAYFLKPGSGPCPKYTDEQCASGRYIGMCGCKMFETYDNFDECWSGYTDEYSVDALSHHGPGLFCGVTGLWDNPDGDSKFHLRWRQQAFFISVAENMCTTIPKDQQRIHNFLHGVFV